jgi:hypothetical protein
VRSSESGEVGSENQAYLVEIVCKLWEEEMRLSQDGSRVPTSRDDLEDFALTNIPISCDFRVFLTSFQFVVSRQ